MFALKKWIEASLRNLFFYHSVGSLFLPQQEESSHPKLKLANPPGGLGANSKPTWSDPSAVGGSTSRHWFLHCLP